MFNDLCIFTFRIRRTIDATENKVQGDLDFFLAFHFPFKTAE